MLGSTADILNKPALYASNNEAVGLDMSWDTHPIDILITNSELRITNCLTPES
jgi:hypothetical protein